MKVLYSVSIQDALNPFLKTLTDAMKQEFDTVKFGFNTESIWNNIVYDYDILHIMWPEFLVDNNHSAVDLRQRLAEIKLNGVKIVSTCHNLEPHYCQDQSKYDAIKFSYELSDVIHHLGRFSLTVLSKAYPNIKHELIPHHIYDNLYRNIPSKEQACEYLGLSSRYDYILCLGAIRSQEEADLVKYVAKNLEPGLKLIAPSLILNIGKRSEFKTRLKYYWTKYIRHRNRLISNIGLINDNELPYYMAISDISLIQRHKILNSGNVPLGMYAGNVIIGPDIGNVGEILKDTGNFAFKQVTDLPYLLDYARIAVKDGRGIDNKKYALAHWTSSIIAKKILNSYLSILTIK